MVKGIREELERLFYATFQPNKILSFRTPHIIIQISQQLLSKKALKRKTLSNKQRYCLQDPTHWILKTALYRHHGTYINNLTTGIFTDVRCLTKPNKHSPESRRHNQTKQRKEKRIKTRTNRIKNITI